MSDSRDVRRRCQARLEELRISARSLDELREEVSQLRKRPLQIRAVTGIAPLMGLWIATAALDLIIVTAETSEWHRQHIAAHELAHMLLGHRPPAVADTLHALLPDLHPEMISGVLQRAGGYNAIEEHEAEVLATMIAARLARPVTRPAGDILGRLDRFAG